MKALKLFWGGVSILALLALGACNNDEPQQQNDENVYDDAYYASLASISSSDSNYTSTSDGGTIYFKTEGGSATVNVECGCEWTIENSASDLFSTSLSSSSLTITASQNYVEQDVTGTITFITANARITFATLTITQSAYGAPEISVETNEWNAPASGVLTTEIGVESSLGTWEVNNTNDWLTVENTESGITLTATENTETTGRSGKITLTATDGYRSASEIITVTQDAVVYLTLDVNNLSFTAEAESGSVTVESNFDWDYSYDNSIDWFTVDRSEDGLTVSVTANGSDERTGTISVTSGDGAENVAEAQITVSQYGIGAMILTYTLSQADQQITLPLSGTVNCTVNWGDGSDTETVTSSQPAHTYSEAGEYNVCIEGSVTALSHSGIAAKGSENKTLTAIKQWGTTGLTTMANAFYYCTGLVSIPSDVAHSFDDVTSFQNGFYYCSSLAALPEGLFANCGKVTSFRQCFDYCSSISSVPDRLFNGCSKVTTFYGIFTYCSSLKTVGEGVFGGCTANTTFQQAFYGCTSLTTIPADLFSDSSAVTVMSALFYNCSKLTEIPAGLFDACTNLEDVNAIFYGCSTIAKVPEELFKNCTKIYDAGSVLYNCSSVTSVPADLFSYCPEIEYLDYVFYGSGITGLPEGIFDNNTEVTTFNAAFYHCYSLSSIPTGLFDKNTKVTTLHAAFSGCPLKEIPTGLLDNMPGLTDLGSTFVNMDITSIPEGLFKNCTKVTTFNATFQNCSGLTSIPDGLFDSCVAAKNMSLTFTGCTSLKSIPSGLFDYCTAATDFDTMFNQCPITSVPEGLFDNCPSVTNFSYLFAFTSLTSVPENIFAKCPLVTNFAYAFRATPLASIPAGLFANNTKVTNFSYAFYSCTSLTGESAYDVITVNGEDVKVHLYERSNYSDVYTAPTNYTSCYNSCTGLSDYSSIPSGWGGGSTTNSLSTESLGTVAEEQVKFELAVNGSAVRNRL